MFQKGVFLVLLVLGAIAYQAQGNSCMVHETFVFTFLRLTVKYVHRFTWVLKKDFVSCWKIIALYSIF